MSEEQSFINQPDFEANDWGLSTAIDLYDCASHLIRSKSQITSFVAQLVTLLKMKAFGETQVVFFGQEAQVAGFSMTQLIETSLISGHFANQSNGAYIDIFSCKPYDPEAAALFAKSFFQAQEVRFQTVRRK